MDGRDVTMTNTTATTSTRHGKVICLQYREGKVKITCEPEANTPLRKGSGFGRSGDEGELSVTDPVMAEMTGCRSCGDEQQEHGSGDDQHKKHAPTVAGVIVGQHLTIT
uniref:Uncharacterized protein n=1 Tax=Oryza nivara TaxID=4536 RepID=A0A0E0G651_ORYNI